jgi:hypothetical protein
MHFCDFSDCVLDASQNMQGKCLLNSECLFTGIYSKQSCDSLTPFLSSISSAVFAVRESDEDHGWR